MASKSEKKSQTACTGRRITRSSSSVITFASLSQAVEWLELEPAGEQCHRAARRQVVLSQPCGTQAEWLVSPPTVERKLQPPGGWARTACRGPRSADQPHAPPTGR